MKKIDVEKLMQETNEGYSYDRYGELGWRKSIENLISLGYTETRIKEIMLSKLTRWAGDEFGPSMIDGEGYTTEDWGHFTGDEIVEYHKKYGLNVKRF